MSRVDGVKAVSKVFQALQAQHIGVKLPLDAEHIDVPVLYRIAADQDAVLHIQHGNTARRMPRQPDNLKLTVPEVEFVPMLQRNDDAFPVLAVVIV